MELLLSFKILEIVKYIWVGNKARILIGIRGGIKEMSFLISIVFCYFLWQIADIIEKLGKR